MNDQVIKAYTFPTIPPVDDSSEPESATEDVDSEQKEETNFLPNDLRVFSSYNYIFTLSCLTVDEINKPDVTYRQNKPEIIILQSGGGVPPQSGKHREYFIDNVEISSLIAPTVQTRQTNATKITFDIIEPYSMGMFLETLQLTAALAGHLDYLEAPYLLEVDFIGWDTNRELVQTENSLRRMFPLKIINIEFSVNESGSVYNVTGLPWHEQAFSNQIQSTKENHALEGSTVHELCTTGGKSISTIFTGREIAREESGELTQGDQYIVTFPIDPATANESEKYVSDDTVQPAAMSMRKLSEERRDQIYLSISGSSGDPPADFDADLSQLLGVVVRRSAIGEAIREYAENTDNMNEIAKSEMIDNYLTAKRTPFARAGFVEKDGIFERGGIQIPDNKTNLTFPGSITIQEMIEEIVLSSKYGRKITETQPDANGMIPWFKIDAHVFLLQNTEQERSSGIAPRVFVYRVYPHFVHVNRFGYPLDTSFGLNALQKQCVKKYDYMYTGQNDDVLEFDLRFDKAFFTALSSFKSNKSEIQRNNQERMGAADVLLKSKRKEVGQSENQIGYPRVPIRQNNIPSSGNRSGYSTLLSIKVARDFADALLNSDVDLVLATIKILGDPYYIADSGMGNYSADKTATSININSDGTIDYERSECDILINFQTPIDYPEEEGYIERFETIRQFSGLYQVTQCTNTFTEGVFTQDLKLIRRRNQDEYDTNAEELQRQKLIEFDEERQKWEEKEQWQNTA